jgi:PAS domain S-box-containing protein
MSDTRASPDEGARAPESAFARARRQCYEIAEDDSIGVWERKRRVLAVGREFLGVENGHVERVVDEETHRVTVSVNGDASVVTRGETFDRAKTFCRRTLDGESALAVSDATAGAWETDPARETRGLDCYLGAPVTVDGKRYGTVCFVSRDARTSEFVPTERAFVELVARLFGRLVEERRHAETVAAHRRARDRTAAKYESLVAAAPDAVVVAEADSRRVVEANDAASDLLGLPREAILGRRVETFCPPEDREDYVAAFASMLDDAPASRDRLADGSRLAVRHDDGTRVPVSVSANVVDLGGEPHVHTVVRDVSDRERRDRLIDVMHRVFRHNLRNDMNVIGGTARSLAADLDGEAAARAARIDAVATDLVDLAAEVRTLRTALHDDRDPAPTDVVAIADRVAAVADAPVTVDAPPRAAAVVSPRFDDALAALVENAVEHGGDEVRVEVEQPPDDVVVRVVDDGPGIPAQERRVLEGAETTALDHGSGVGMRLVNWVVTNAGGEVETRADDGGSMVTLRLPPAAKGDPRR